MARVVFLLHCLLVVNLVWSIRGETTYTCEDKNVINESYITSNVAAKYIRGQALNVFSWLDSCQNIENKIVGLSELHKTITNNPNDDIDYWTIKFAKVLEENILPQVSDGTGLKLENKYRDLLLDLHYAIPTCAINLILESSAFLENKRYQECLVASELRENGESSNRNVFLSSISPKSFNQSKWDVQIVEDKNRVAFSLTNFYYNGETFFVSGLTNNFADHILYSSTYGYRRQSEWILEPADEFGTACLLRNLYWDEYLCAYDEKFYEMSHYRRIFTTTSRSIADPACHFEIKSF